MIRHEDIDDGRIWSKLHKSSCCPSLCPPCNLLFHPCRKAVSGKKMRYQKDSFDLDLVYLAPRIIVHGFPAIGLEHVYRNPRYEIKRLLDKYHPGHYKMFNFCCEPGRGYSPDVFEGRVERYPFKDHNTPPLASMVAFANSAKSWLDADPDNVCSLHCKAGKGRAGLMSCILLFRSGVASTAKEALEIYDAKRVTNRKALTVTSQRKYVMFYEALWRDFWHVQGNIGAIPADAPDSTEPRWVLPEEPKLTVYGVEILGVDAAHIKKPRIKVFQGTNFLPDLLFDSGKTSSHSLSIDFEGVDIQGNFKISFEVAKGIFGKTLKVFELWHNTLFMNKNLTYVDFDISQLDIKRSVKAKFGEKIVVRVKLVKSSGSGQSVQEGYKMVPATEDDANLNKL